MRVALTDLAIRSLKVPEKGQRTYLDKNLPGFGVRVSQGGTKTFVLMHGPIRQLTTIGRFPIISLAAAREKARNVLAEEQLGIRRPTAPRFDEALDLFVTKHCHVKNRARTAAETERLLRKHFLPSLRHLRLDEITGARISRITDDLLNRPSAARHAFVAVRTFFRWCCKRGFIAASPIALMDAPALAASRDRVLTDHELVVIYRRAVSQGCSGGKIVRLLILTGQRRGEISGLRGEWINRDTKTITLPSEITKNARIHTFPYGDLAAAIIEDLPTEGFLFPARGAKNERSYNGWSKLRRSIDPGVPEWTLHDLRRTFATNLAALDVAPHIIERILNHASGAISGVAAIYNRFSYLDGMREAIQKWESRLRLLLADERFGGVMRTSDTPIAA
jgi:integrase